ncbi:MAG: hypothetical protein AB7P04_08810 [Bacteriovoracia bacterium]
MLRSALGIIIAVSFVCLIGVSWVYAGPKDPQVSYALRACTDSESWNFSGKIDEKWQSEFKAFLSKRISPVRAFSEGLALRRIAEDAEARTFGEYWVSRALLHAELPHLAYAGFSAIIDRPLTEENIGPTAAAIDCLMWIQARYPSLDFPSAVSARLFEFSKFPKNPTAYNPVIWNAANAYVRDLIHRGGSEADVKPALDLVRGGGSFEALANGMWAAKRGLHSKVIKSLYSFLYEAPIPPVLEKFTDSARLLISRSYYSTHKYGLASDELKKVKKSSNDLAEALSELSWAYLQSEQYGEAIGTTINLQSGGLRKTFSPEAPMVMAMALNEICQFPEAIKAVNIFRRNFHGSFEWLKQWNDGDKSQSLYNLAVKYLKNEAKVPERVASEWVRSPLFISRQDEINLVFKEKDSTAGLGRAGAKEQLTTAKDLLKFLQDFRKKYHLAKVKLKPGEPLPRLLLDELGHLRDQVAHYSRLRRAAPVWRTILANYEKRSPSRIAKLSQDINSDLKRMTARMHRQLNEIAENNYFIEVEIFNGASRDIIWQNAYPDYEKVAKKLDKDNRPSTGSKEWDWGSVSAGLDGSGEIWEDELGSFKANLFDNCSSKDRYLAMKREDALKKAELKKVK